MFPPAGGGGVLKRFVERGGGLLVVSGDRATWPQGEAELLPGTIRRDRSIARRAAADRSGFWITATRCSKCSRRRAAATSPPPTCSATGRCRQRRPTASSRASTMARWRRRRRRSAAGRVHRLDHDARRLVDRHRGEAGVPAAGASARPLPGALRAADLVAHGRTGARPGRPRTKAGATAPDRIVVTPSGERISQSSAGEGDEGLLELNEQGIYEIRSTGAAERTRPEAIAVNIDPAGVGLSSPIDPRSSSRR